jgi:hypothetical protein
MELPLILILRWDRLSKHPDTTMPKPFAKKLERVDTAFMMRVMVELPPSETYPISHLIVINYMDSQELDIQPVSEELLASQVPNTSILIRAANLVR